MRWLRTLGALIIAVTVSGCAIIEAEKNNRGGFLDHVADELWMRADSKKMRALRAVALEASLARIAMVTPKSAPDRGLIARRIGETTKRAEVVRKCAFFQLMGQQPDEPCFFFDSVMVDYENALFDLAMLALPIEDARNLINRVSGGIASASLNPLELVQSLIDIGRQAFRYGRVVGAIYRDTLELEVQVWLASPGLELETAALRAIYAAGNDHIPSWRAEIARLRAQGLEPVPDPRFFGQIYAIIQYVCGQIVGENDPTLNECRSPTGVPSMVATSPGGTLFRGTVTRVGGGVISVTTRARRARDTVDDGGAKLTRLPTSDEMPEAQQILDPYSKTRHGKIFVRNLQDDLCVPSTEFGVIGPATKALIAIFEDYRYARRPELKDGKLNDAEITEIRQQPRCVAGGGQNYFEKAIYTDTEEGRKQLLQLIIGLNRAKVAPTDLPETTTLEGARARIREARMNPAFNVKLKLQLPDALAGQVTRDFVVALPR